ncbi:MAG: hypothetical protein ACI9G1_004798 [Pirellulaceae bacterium]|jgi:hypothetical protein
MMPRIRMKILALSLLFFLVGGRSQASDNTTLLSQLSVGVDACTETLHKEGNLVAIARRHDGCAIIDVANPTNPILLANVNPDPTTIDIWDVNIHNGYLYLMNRPEGVDTNLGNWVGVYIYDLATPNAPVHVGQLLWGGGAWYHLAGSVSAGTVADIGGTPYAFLCSDITSSVEVFDMTTPASPVFVTSIYRPEPFATCSNVAVNGDYLYTAWGDGGFTIHDMSVPLLPYLEAHQVYTGPPVINGGLRTISPTPDGTHVVTGEYTNSGTVRLWDVSNFGAITEEATWALGSGALLWTVQTTDDYAFVAHLEDGVQILDIRNRTQLNLVACFDETSGSPSGVWSGIADIEIDGTTVYASHQTLGLLIFEFGDQVNVTKAEWKRRRKELKVWATSSAQDNTTLEVIGYGVMSWNRKKKRHELKIRNVNSNPGTVYVVSDLNGTDQRVVRVR